MNVIKTKHEINLYGSIGNYRIRLRPLDDRHLPLIYKWNADPEVVYWCDDNDNDDGNDENSVNSIYGYVSGMAYCFLVEANGIPIGDCWLQNMNIDNVSEMYPNRNVKRIDMMIGEKDWWGKGIGSALVGMITDFAFESDNVDILHIPCIFDFNVRSQKAFIKNGYKFVKAVDVEGRNVKQEYHYALTKEEWTPCYNLTYERKVIQYSEAIEITENFAKELHEKFQDKIMAVFAIGSLGSDYYRPGQSDIDTIIIVNDSRDVKNQMYRDVRQTADRYQEEYNIPKGFGAIIVAEEQLYPPYIKSEELILEILRLKTQSKLIYGSYDIEKIPMPGKQAVIDDAIAFEEWLDGESKKDEYKKYLEENSSLKDKHTVKEFSSGRFVNSALISLKRYLIIKHGIIEFNKFKVIGLYLDNAPPFVNDEVFDYINAVLQGKTVELDDEKILRMEKWSDVLSAGIDNLVLYNN